MANQAVAGNRGRRVASEHSVGAGKAAAIIVAALAAVAVAAYAGLCAASAGSDTFFQRTSIAGIDVGGMSVSEAAAQLNRDMPALFEQETVVVQLEDSEETVSSTLSRLGLTADGEAIAETAMEQQQGYSFLTSGWHRLFGSSTHSLPLSWDESTLTTETDAMASQLYVEPVDMSYTVDGTQIQITKGRDGRTVDGADIREAIQAGVDTSVLGNGQADTQDQDLHFTVASSEQAAGSMTAQQIYDETSTTMKNASYDVSTGSIVPEQSGASFDVTAAQASIDAADPGSVITIQATVEEPKVTAAVLKDVLFRDVLGTATTKVGGTSARKTNVRLATESINGTVMNSSDIFSYNETLGQRTAEKGYQPAPAYVQGETVDEIGGGICQVSSTLYLACLNSNLNIVERYNHRYKPSYIELGMDATVSWGSPDYRFSNDTDYPIKIQADYDGTYVTVKIIGTKTDNLTVKMTHTVSADGYTVVSYRNIYENGNLISSNKEATSTYKAHVSDSSTTTTTETQTETETQTQTEPETQTTQTETPQTETPATEVTPTTTETSGTTATPETPAEPATPETPETPTESAAPETSGTTETTTTSEPPAETATQETPETAAEPVTPDAPVTPDPVAPTPTETVPEDLPVEETPSTLE